jgi:thiol-disulfide isomerase/thioredoxin
MIPTSMSVPNPEEQMPNIQSSSDVSRRVLRGAIQGAVGFGFAALVASAAMRSDLAGAGERGILFALIGALCLGAGRAVGRGTIGAVVGGLVGMVVGALPADRLGAHPLYALPDSFGRKGALEIAGPTVEGEAFSSSRWRGKVVLVDFWATWCVPCLEELPNVHEVYDRYHADGLEVVGVSLDNSRESLERFVKKNGIPWPQIFFPNARGWNNPLARENHIQSIPTTFLLDSQGQVAATDARGPGLGAAVAMLLGKDTPLTLHNLPYAKLELRTMPPWLIAGLFLGCLGGSLSGALLERAVQRFSNAGTTRPQAAEGSKIT